MNGATHRRAVADTLHHLARQIEREEVDIIEETGASVIRTPGTSAPTATGEGGIATLSITYVQKPKNGRGPSFGL